MDMSGEVEDQIGLVDVVQSVSGYRSADVKKEILDWYQSVDDSVTAGMRQKVMDRLASIPEIQQKLDAGKPIYANIYDFQKTKLKSAFWTAVIATAAISIYNGIIRRDLIPGVRGHSHFRMRGPFIYHLMHFISQRFVDFLTIMLTVAIGLTFNLTIFPMPSAETPGMLTMLILFLVTTIMKNMPVPWMGYQQSKVEDMTKSRVGEIPNPDTQLRTPASLKFKFWFLELPSNPIF